MALSLAKNCIIHSKVFFGNKSLLSNIITKSRVSIDCMNTGTLSRSFYSLSRNKSFVPLGNNASRMITFNNCSYLHTKGDQELVAFLDEEIKNEIKNQERQLPNLGDFTCKLSGAEVELTKKLEGETIIINANVNGSVDAEDTTMDPNDTKEPQEAEMKAKPDFTVSIIKGNKTLCFECTYSHDLGEEETEAIHDSFQIDELSLFENEANDSTYTVSGDIMDGYLYDLLMNYLEERGVSNDFADKMIAYFTSYEHQLYIKQLQDMKSFIEKK